MVLKKILQSTFLVCCMLLLGEAAAQQTQAYVDKDAEYLRGLDLFHKQKYASAQEAFRNIMTTQDENSLVRSDAEYYNALCAMELFNKDAEVLLKNFLSNNPESPKVHQVYFHLGRYNYRKKDYKESLEWFARVDMRDLSKEELHEFLFKRGYDYFEVGKTDSARIDFYELKDIDTKYSHPANYYFSHIEYTEGRYETALQGFLKLVKDEAFGPVVPYYIAQIYYLQGKYDEVIVYAPTLLDSSKTKRAGEVARIIGESYYRTGRFAEAIPYFERHRMTGSGMTRNDVYQLGYAYYKGGKYAEAISLFQDAVGGVSDTLAQNAWYHLADCYVKTDNKPLARNAFGKASELKFNRRMREDALFSYSRLSYELSYSPFNEAIIALQQYINEYPNSPRKDEAYGFLVNVYLSTKNYKEALRSIEQIKVIGPALQPAFQQVCYNRAVELFNNKDWDGAIQHFDKSTKYPVSRKLTAYAYYWSGESFYKKAEQLNHNKTMYGTAIDRYKSFQATPGASNLPEFNTANYNIGYALFNQADYENGAVWFRKFVADKSSAKSERLGDAYLRMADAYYLDTNYMNASEYYGDATKQNIPNKDYALYQQAMALGLLGKKEEKANTLGKLMKDYPKSPYVNGAGYQQALTYHNLGQYEKALESYQALYTKDPNGLYATTALMQMGLIYQTNLMDFNKALEKYLAVVAKSTGSQQREALQQCKEIYIAKGQIEEWDALRSKYAFNESGYAQDSAAFVSLVNVYKEGTGDCNAVASQAAKYLQKYPAGFHLVEVHYMKAECAYKNNDIDNALASYRVIIDKPNGKFTETALLRSSFIYYKQKDYTNAAAAFERVESLPNVSTANRNDAQVNLMRCYLMLNKFDTASTYAAKVLNIEKLQPDIYVQAHYIKGKAAFNKGIYETAATEFNLVMKGNMKNEMEAEAKYDLIYMGYLKKGYKTAEKELFKYVSDYGAYPVWKGRGFLLLADDYLALKDTFQAKFILKSYAESGDVPELKQQAIDKLHALEALEQKRSAIKEEEMVVPLDGGTPNDLFDNEDKTKGGGQ